jgi:uncharacterized protein
MSKIKSIVSDGWKNLLSGFGTSHDPTSYSEPGATLRLPKTYVERIYRSDGIGRRIVDVPAEDMTREWVTVSGQDGQERMQQLRNIHARQQINKAIRWAGLYGGAIIVLGIDDGRNLDTPVGSRVRGVYFAHVYDCWQMYYTTQDMYKDPMSEKYGKPEYVTVQPVSGTPYKVHESRILWFDGEDVPDRVRQENNGWGDSKLQGVTDSLSRYAEAMGGVSNIIRDFVTPVLGMKNLSDLIASGQEETVRKRLEILGLSQSMLNIRLIDAEMETYSKQASSIAGMDKLLEELKHNISACTGIPQTRLFGRSPGGQNATGESDLTNWYDTIRSEQQDKMIPAVERIVSLLDLAAGGIPDDRKIEPCPLWQPSESERATTAKTITEATATALDYGLITVEAGSRTLEQHGIDTGMEDV